jgi:hypothetical protein
MMDSANSQQTGRLIVVEEPEALSSDSPLFRLLRHYAEPGEIDREAWQDRLMALEGLTGRDLSRLHGELIAQGWVEQNTGSTPSVRLGVATGCYRVTLPGLRAYRKALSGVKV